MIKIWRTKNWAEIFNLKKHTKGVTALELHSSGRLLFSYGKD